MDIDIMQRQLIDLTNLVPMLVARMDALERTIGAQQRQLSDLINLAPAMAHPEEAAEKSTPHKK